MELSDLDYELPPELIAQTPAPSRDASRLLVIDRARGGLEDHGFAELPDLLRPGDCLVVNNSRVIPARVLARDAAGRQVELLFFEAIDPRRWRALTRPGRRSRGGVELADDVVSGPEEQVIRVGEHDLGARRTKVVRRQRLHRGVRADRHEDRRLHDAVRRGQPSGARGSIGGGQLERHRINVASP